MKKKIENILTLAINYDEVSKEYINVFLEKFSNIFNEIYFVSELANFDNGYKSKNIKFTTNLKSLILENEWLLVLNENEFPSIQFLNNFVDIINNINNDVKIIRLPIVIYSSLEDKIIDILEPLPRVFKSNPQLLKSSLNDEIELEEIPLVKIL